jgi:hypothetical protein
MRDSFLVIHAHREKEEEDNFNTSGYNGEQISGPKFLSWQK